MIDDRDSKHRITFSLAFSLVVAMVQVMPVRDLEAVCNDRDEVLNW